MAAKLIMALLSIGLAALCSGALFPPGHVPRQLTVVVIWLIVGISIGWVWAQRS